ncbi:MAG: N-acetyl sugar amidotransferase [Xanthobacteraceae bacterium]|jgi:N-acetyl sugar amidotransferase
MNKLQRSVAADQAMVCTRCVMDGSAPSITFDRDGVCNYCHEADRALQRVRLSLQESERRLAAIAAEVSRAKTKDGYDSVIGLSGGVDSSYTALLAHKLGLRPLAVHLDNGWDSETAVSNIRGVVERCSIDLVTLVIDWPEFRDLQRAFFKAGVIDIELLSDNAIMASMFRLCREHGCRFILSGTNVATEHGIPREWAWGKYDVTNIRAIHRRFGSVPLKTFPTMGLLATIFQMYLPFGPRFVEPLNVVNYRKTDAVETLKRDAGWRDYGGKHYESTFTKFYQAYILPTKFGIDKRRVHLSALIRNHEIDRNAALAALARPLYDPDELRRDKEYVIKKLGFTETEFDRLMREAPVPHDRYRSDRPIREALKRVARFRFSRA